LRQCVLGVAAAVLLATPAAAQLPALGAPRGVFRIEIGGDFATASDQFLDGTSQPYRAQFTTPIIGAAFYPELAPAQSWITQLSGISGYTLSVGQSRMQAQVSAGVLRLGGTLGITSKLSLFGVAPIVKQQVEVAYAFDSAGANSGYNPASPTFGTADGALFRDSLNLVVDSLGTLLASGYYDGSPTTKALAQSTYAYLSGLDSLYQSSPFVPLDSSAAGAAMSAGLAAAQANLAGLSVPSFAQPLPLPTAALTGSEYNSFLTSGGGPVLAAPFTTHSSFLLGDVELGALYTIIDRWNAPGRPGGLRLVARALVRLPTGTQPLPNDFVSIPTGGGQTDLQASLVADVGGGKFGARFEGSYTNQMSATVNQRVTLPSQPIPWANRLASVTRDPGNEFLLSATPYFQLAPGLALVAVVRYWSHGADAVSYASGAAAIPGVSASDLAVGTDASATVLGGGISYAPMAKPGGRVPLDAFWLYESVMAASGGVVPKVGTIRMGLRWPVRLWGGTATQ
jgi:hypothetical protein